MKFVTVEHCDDFGDEAIFWVGLSALPQGIQDEARRIDKEHYNPSCFGMCVGYDAKTKIFCLSPDEANNTNVYYVNNNGDRVWFWAEMTEEFMNEVFSACEKELSKRG